MIEEINRTCETLNEKLGLTVHLPTPKKSVLKKTALCHLLVGAGLTATGVALPSKWCLTLGGISIASSFILCHEQNHHSSSEH